MNLPPPYNFNPMMANYINPQSFYGNPNYMGQGQNFYMAPNMMMGQNLPNGYQINMNNYTPQTNNNQQFRRAPW